MRILNEEAIKILENVSVWTVIVIIATIVFIAKMLKTGLDFIGSIKEQFDAISNQTAMLESMTKQLNLNNEATLGMLRYRLRRQCQKVIMQGFLTNEMLEDLVSLYKSYKAMGGNGTIDKLYNEAIQTEMNIKIDKR